MPPLPWVFTSTHSVAKFPADFVVDTMILHPVQRSIAEQYSTTSTMVGALFVSTLSSRLGVVDVLCKQYSFYSQASFSKLCSSNLTSDFRLKKITNLEK